MTSIFDGLAGVVADVFGAPVTIAPGGASPVTIQAVLRQRQIEVAAEDGEPVIMLETVLRAPSADVATLVEGDLVTDVLGRSWRVRYRLPPDAPSLDRLEEFVLRRVGP